ncbi:heavy metal-associated domain-containing protein [Desulfobacterales bacterium HSG17]|nr:heavy metal-associated domain-containing protein [Desulfobacterales bacterium HSG17]
MSKKREIKKIDIQTLDSVKEKASKKIIQKTLLTIALLISISAVGWGAHKVMADEVLETRFIVNKMTCPGCIGKVKKACTIPGVVGAEVSLVSQTAFIRYHEKQTNPETIKEAMKRAGYPAKPEGTFKSDGKGVNDSVVAIVDRRPIFKKDMDMSLWQGKVQQDKASDFYDLLMVQTILKEAETSRIFAHPFEIQQETERQKKILGLTSGQMKTKVVADYGSMEKFIQVTGNKIGLQKMTRKILAGTQDSADKKSIIAKWLGERFKKLDVKIHDKDLKNQLTASTGSDSWEKSWPHMINRETILTKSIIN